MNLYETTFILNPQADDATLDRQVKAITDLIGSNDGKILHEDRLGTRRLAYEIQGIAQGYFTSVYFEGAGTLPKILDRHYRLEEPYLRHLTVVFEGDMELVTGDRTDTIPPEFGGRPLSRDGDGGSRYGGRSAGSGPDSRRTDAKKAEAKTEESKPVEAKPVEAKTEESKPVEAKPVETKTEESKPVEAKPVETKPESDTEQPKSEPKSPAADNTYSEDDEL